MPSALRLDSGRGAAALICALWTIAIAALWPTEAFAHGVIVGRRDVPIPEWLFGWAAAVVLIVSFVALSLAWRTSRLADERGRPIAAGLSRALINPLTEILAALAGIGLLVLTVWSGLEGTPEPDENFSVTFVFVTVWLGFAGLSVVFGDLFRAFNPWRAIARALAGGFELIAGQRPGSPFTYPERLGRWPAAIGILVFAWFELVWGTGFSAVGLEPHDVAIATLVYSAYTLGGMLAFGIEPWCDRGEPLSVYFGMFSRLAPIGVESGRLHLRRPLAGATSWAQVPGSVALVLIVIGMTSFDGGSEGLLSEPIETVFGWFRGDEIGTAAEFRITNTLFLAASVAAVALIFELGVRGVQSVDRERSAAALRRAFGHSFIPIALAYLAAHYFSLLIFGFQTQIALISDPLGDGADLFGTADVEIDYGLLGATVVWYVQVGVLIAGHVAALVIAHDRAVSLYEDPKRAARSQYWMLGLMVAFTTLGLFLLSQSNA